MFLYIIASFNKRTLHAGFCKDLGKMKAFYDAMPTLSMFPEKANRVIYFEEILPENAEARLTEVTRMPLVEKYKLIESTNKEWRNLLP